MQAAHPKKADAIGRAHAAIVEGHVVDLGDGNGKVLSRNGHTWHTVNGVCDCQAAAFGKPCRHLQAWKLYQHVTKKVQPQALPAVVEPAPPAPGGIDPRYLTYIRGKPFVRFDGLLALAHERGLVELSTTVVSVMPDFAVCQAVARFQDGLVVTDIGDASPTNVKKHLAPHFVRMAATRSAARALRRALNISEVAVEELGETLDQEAA